MCKKKLNYRDAAQHYQLRQAETLIRIYEEYKDDPAAFAKALQANTDSEGKIIPLAEIRFR
jgi:hypothetical protein